MRVLGIRKATSWYNTHLDLNNPPIRGQKRSVPSVVLVTDDAMNREKAKSEGTPVTSRTCSHAYTPIVSERRS